MDAADRELFLSLGLENALKQIEQNPAMGTATKSVFAASGLAGAPAERIKAAGTLLYTVASSVPDSRAARREVIAKLIGSGAIVTPAQVAGAVDFFKKKTPDAPYDEAELHKACGAGIKFTDEQIAAKVRPRPGVGGSLSAGRCRERACGQLGYRRASHRHEAGGLARCTVAARGALALVAWSATGGAVWLRRSTAAPSGGDDAARGHEQGHGSLQA